MSKKVVSGSFLAIVAKDARPYENYPHVDKRVSDMEIPIILMINRWDGKIGFPGGTIDAGETALQAVIREAIEEIDAEFEPDELEYVGVTRYEDDRIDLTTHLYAYFTDYEELKDIALGITEAEHFGSEATGFVMIQCVDSKKGGYSEFLKNNFPPTAREQLENLVEKYDLLKVE